MYITPLYLFSACRPSASQHRDLPSVIYARTQWVSLSCVGCLLFTLVILGTSARLPLPDLLHSVGCWPLGIREAASCLTLVVILFIGPLFEYFVVGPGLHEWSNLRPIKAVWSDPTTFRTIIVGPITEELLFRGCAIPLLLVSSLSHIKIIFLSPLVFGLAHVHHLYEFRLTHPNVKLSVAMLRTIFQLSFTTMFGALASFVFIRSGSLLATILIHAFCNSMGFPPIGRRLYGPLGPSWLWTSAYHLLLVTGLVAFWEGLWYWTESPLALLDSGSTPPLGRTEASHWLHF